ncbi:MAG: hypothetical protein AB7E47_07860 [Desulfovibrionaceae bacterium]
MFKGKNKSPEAGDAKPSQPFLHELVIEAKPKDYTIPFFPDVRIPNTPETAARWHDFIEILSPKLRIGQDPASKVSSVGIMFRDGAWLGDLVLADDVRSFNVIEDVTLVKGSLVSRGARVKNKGFMHALRVEGDLEVHKDLLRETPPDLTVGGGMTILGVKNVATSNLSPLVFKAWGLLPGSVVRVARKGFVFLEEVEKGETVYVLRAEEEADPSYYWDLAQWTEMQKAEMGPQALQAVYDKLGRVCKFIGLAPDFIICNKRKLGWNIRKICLYLTLLQNELGGGFDKSKDAAKAQIIDGVIAALRSLEKLVIADTGNDAAIMAGLDAITDDMLEAVKTALADVQGKADDTLIKRDIAYCARLLKGELSVNELMTSTPRTALFLTRALDSAEARRGAMLPLRGMAEAFKALLTALGLEKRITLAHLLKTPDRTLEYLRDRAEKAGKADLLAALADSVQALHGKSPRDVVKESFTPPGGDVSEAASSDRRFLSDLFGFQGDLDQLGIAGPKTLELLLVNFESFMTRALEQVRKSLREECLDADKGVCVMCGNLVSKNASEFVACIKARLEWDLSVFRSFNSVGSAIKRLEAIEKDRQAAPVQEKEFEEPPIEILNDVLFRLNRICLILGLGKNFVEQHGAGYDRNIEKLRFFFRLFMENSDAARQQPSAENAKTLETADKILAAIHQLMQARDFATVQSLVNGLNDGFLRSLHKALSEPRLRVDTSGLKQDMRTLRFLSRSNLHLEDIWSTTERLLFYLNGVLESVEAKKVVGAVVKPLRMALAGLDKAGAATGGVTISDLLRDYEQTMVRLREANPGASGERLLREMERAVEALREPALKDVLNVLRNYRFSEDEAAVRDKAFLVRLTDFHDGTLGHLDLTTEKSARLLLMHMSGPGAEELKAMFETGKLKDKTTLGMIHMLQARLEWRLLIIQAYNTHVR